MDFSPGEVLGEGSKPVVPGEIGDLGDCGKVGDGGNVDTPGVVLSSTRETVDSGETVVIETVDPCEAVVRFSVVVVGVVKCGGRVVVFLPGGLTPPGSPFLAQFRRQLS